MFLKANATANPPASERLQVPTDACEEPQGAEVVEGESHHIAIPDRQTPATFKIQAYEHDFTIDIDFQGGARSCPPAVFEGFLVFRQHFCALETFWRFHMLTKHVGLPFHRLVQVATEFNSVKRSSFQGV